MNAEPRDERYAALDEFATTRPEGDRSLPVPVTPPHAMQVVGAQAVAVRRDEQLVLQRLKVLAAAAGEHWYYRYPVKNRRTGTTDWIEGPSIKLANNLARLYGNCEVDCRVQDIGSMFLYHARFIDLETGFALTRPFQQAKSAAKIGGEDDARRLDIALQIGASKAIRNVVVNALETYADFAFDEAKHALVDKIGSNLDQWRRRTAEKLGAKLDIRRVEAVVGRPAGEWLAGDVAKVIAMGKAVEDGMASLDDTFPPLKAEADSSAALDQFAEGPQEQQNSAGESNGAVAGEADAQEPPSAPEASPAEDKMDVARKLQVSAIDMCLRLAASPQLTEQEKLERLDTIAPALDGVAEEFVKTIVRTAADVAQGRTKPLEARRYLEGLVK